MPAPHAGGAFREDVNRQIHERWEQEGTLLPTYYSDDIHAGDAMYWDDALHAVRPVSAFTWNASWAQTCQDLAEVFRGISAYAKAASTDTDRDDEILVLTDGEYRVHILTATTHLGPLDWLAPADSGANTLLDQEWDRSAAIGNACAAAQTYQAAVAAGGRALVRIASVLRCTTVNAETG